MIKGFDVSHWNGKEGIDNALAYQPENSFVFIKATEGKTYTDPMMYGNYRKAEEKGLAVGFYHYARPENNTPVEEGVQFVNMVRPYIGKAVLALDYEGKALTAGGQDWALEWLNFVYGTTGVRPMIYLQGSAVKDYGKIAESDYGLWIACWSGKTKMESYLKHWKTWAVWQHTDYPFDQDWFNGTREQFMKYAAVKLPESEGSGHCGCCCGGRCKCMNEKEVK